MVVSMYDGGFGGVWAATSLMLQLSAQADRPVYYAGDDLRPLAIAPFLHSPGTIQASCAEPDVLFIHPSHHDAYARLKGFLPVRLLRWRVAFARLYCRTTATWHGAGSRRIAYQFVPGKEGAKSCKPGQIEQFEPAVRALGYTPVRLGAHLGIAGSIKHAAAAELFVGVDSGMSHLCHSVGTPVHLLRNDHPADTIAIMHRGNRYRLHEDMCAFLCWLRGATGEPCR
jgi:Glycosyltransferase family 9 (heptosyltransferase)